MELEAEITKRLETELIKEGDELRVADEKHDGRHYFVEIISDVFDGKSRIDRSRMVHDILNDLMKDDHIHALRLNLKTHKEVDK